MCGIDPCDKHIQVDGLIITKVTAIRSIDRHRCNVDRSVTVHVTPEDQTI